MRKKQKKSLNRRRFLKVPAGSGAAFAAGNQVAGAQQVRPVENTGTGEGEASGARRPGSDFMVDVFKPLGFEYVSINPHSSSRGTPNFRSVQDLAAMVRDFTKWGDVPVSLRQFAQSAVRGHAVAMTPPLMPVVLALDNRLQEEAIPKSMPDRQCYRYPKHRFCQAGSKHVMALTPLAAQQPAGNIESGKRDFVTFACSACHGYSGHGGVEVGAPRIATTALSYTAFAKYVRQPMRSMPRYATEAQLPEVALTDIYAFLKSIPAPPDSKSIPLLQNN